MKDPHISTLKGKGKGGEGTYDGPPVQGGGAQRLHYPVADYERVLNKKQTRE